MKHVAASPSASVGGTAKRAAFEPLAFLLLSLATVGTAWCSFQAAAWGGVTQRFSHLSAAAAREAAAHQLQAFQLGLVDVLLFSQYMNARSASNAPLAEFYSDRFRAEAREAFQRWIAARPFENPEAPAHPFVTNLYQPRLLDEARVKEARSEQLWQQAGEAGRNSRAYILITVLLASALFCGGTVSRFDQLWIRRSVLLLGLLAFLFAADRLLRLPTQL